MDNKNDEKRDPIRTTYFDPLELAEWAADIAFYVAAALSIFVLLVDRTTHPAIYNYTQITFLVIAILGFIISIAVRVYFSPRAQDRRFADFLSRGFGVRLIPDRTENYYNSNV